MNNNRVMKWTNGAREGILVVGGRGRGYLLSQLDFPQGIIVDQLGTLYIADLSNHRIMRWPKGATEGQVIFGGNGRGSLSNEFYDPI
ncbi:unnamed protein product, partial [Rotaria socialis]